MSHTLMSPGRGYSNIVIAEPGRTVFIAGQIGWDASGKMTSSSFEGQFEQALSNVVSLVREAGGQPTDICRVTIYVTDRQAYLDAAKEIGAAYRRLMGKHYPAMTAVEVKALVEATAKVEIEATAVIA